MSVALTDADLAEARARVHDGRIDHPGLVYNAELTVLKECEMDMYRQRKTLMQAEYNALVAAAENALSGTGTPPPSPGIHAADDLDYQWSCVRLHHGEKWRAERRRHARERKKALKQSHGDDVDEAALAEVNAELRAADIEWETVAEPAMKARWLARKQRLAQDKAKRSVKSRKGNASLRDHTARWRREYLMIKEEFRVLREQRKQAAERRRKEA